jgi:23S rRNA (cytosine1962-C5)-methyltransferase
MNFLRLADDLISVLFEDDDILAIDKPYGFNAHTNDAKADHGAAIQDGLIEIYEKNRGAPLHIIHRLDQTTTGVMIFGKSVAAAKKYADFFLNRQVKKTYWFVTDRKSKNKKFIIEKPIVHKAKELEAKTELNFIKAAHGFELWQATPFTGRNHQIRIHAHAAGLSLLGDEKYGGSPFQFLTLHNHKIQFPNGIQIESKPPVFFENLKILKDTLLTTVYFEDDRRRRLFKTESESCYRIVNHLNGAQEPGFSLDKFGSELILNWHRESWTLIEEAAWNEISAGFKMPIWVGGKDLKKRIGGDGKDSWAVKDNKATFEIRSDALASPGLYLNQRLQRKWVANHCHGKSVLSVFANSGSYAVAAAMGQAKEITLVESSKNYLGWAKRNFELNALAGAGVKFLNRDSVTFVESSLNKGLFFDFITCDVPTFFRREKGVFRVEKDFEKLLSDCLKLLAADGALLISTQFDGFYVDDVRRKIAKVKKDLGLKNLEINLVLPSMDFELPDQKANLKSFIIKK